jgi:ABC-type glycerol-3-phosphate transport system substrate-binding protein
MVSTVFAGGKSESAGKPSDTKKGIAMTFWIFLNPTSTEDPRNVVLKEIVEDYNKNNKYGNKVTVESIHWSKFEAQAIQAAAANSGPDIINCYSDQLRQHIAGGTIQPMTTYAEKFLKTIPDYTYTAQDLKIENDIYTLPWESRTFLHWYRSDVFDKAPSSLADLINTRSKKTQGMTLGFVIGLSDGANAAGFMESFIPLVRSAGGDLFDKNGKAIFNSEAGLKVISFMKELVSSGVMNETSLSLGVDDIVDGFKAGTILSMNAGTQRASAIKKSSLVANIKSAPMPGFSADAPAPALVAGQSLGIGKFAKDPEMSFDFITTFYTQESQVKWLKANVLPARSTVFDDPAIKALPNYEEVKTWNKYSGTGRVVFYPPDYTEMAVTLTKAIQKVVFKNDDAKAALDQVANWYNKKNNK